MSGTLISAGVAAFSAVSPLASAVLGLASEILFDDNVLCLGDMDLVDFELPEKIRYGGKQALNKHKQPGGGRVFDDMGDDLSTVAWEGLFFGIDAQIRRGQIDHIRVQGEPVDLAWSDVLLSVYISELSFEETDQRIKYSIVCEIQPPTKENDFEENPNLADGQTPTEPAQATVAGKQAVTNGRAAAPSIPVPPVPPAYAPVSVSPTMA